MHVLLLERVPNAKSDQMLATRVHRRTNTAEDHVDKTFWFFYFSFLILFLSTLLMLDSTNHPNQYQQLTAKKEFYSSPNRLG